MMSKTPTHNEEEQNFTKTQTIVSRLMVSTTATPTLTTASVSCKAIVLSCSIPIDEQVYKTQQASHVIQLNYYCSGGTASSSSGGGSSISGDSSNSGSTSSDGYERFLKQQLSLQGLTCCTNPAQPLPKKVRLTLIEVEQLFTTYSVLHVAYIEHVSELKVLFDNGYIVHFILNSLTSELESIHIDKSMYHTFKNVLASGVMFDQYCVVNQGQDICLYLYQFNNGGMISNFSGSGTNNSGGKHNRSPISCDIAFPIEKLIQMTPKEMKMNHNNSLLGIRYDNSTMAVVNVTDQSMEVISYLPPPTIGTEVMFFAFSNRKPYTLLTVEVSGQTSVYWNVYERVMSREFQKVQSHKIKTTSPVTCCAISPSETHVCICCTDGTILLWTSDNTLTNATSSKNAQNNRLRLTIQRIPGKSDPFLIRWHPLGSLILIAFNTNTEEAKQEFCFFDLGLNVLSVNLANGSAARSLHSSNLIGRKSKIVNYVCWLHSSNHNHTTSDHRTLANIAQSQSHQLIYFMFDRGPMVLARIDLTLCGSMYGVQPMSNLHLLSMHIHNNGMEESRTLVRNITNSTELYTALCVFVNYLLRQLDVDHNGVKARAYLDTILEKYAKLFKDTGSVLSDTPFDPSFQIQTSSSRLSQLHNLYRRYFIYTLRHGYYEKAFQIAAALSDEDMFQQIYHATRECQYYEMSYLCFMKSSESFRKHMRQLKQFIKTGRQTLSDETESSIVSTSELVKRYMSSPMQQWTPEEAERLAVYFEMEGDLDNAIKCFNLSSEVKEQKIRVSTVKEALYDYQMFIDEQKIMHHQ